MRKILRTPRQLNFTPNTVLPWVKLDVGETSYNAF